MLASDASSLQTLASFTVTGDYRGSETAFEVWQPGKPEPVARMHQAGSLESEWLQSAANPTFDVLTGPHNQLAGRVTLGGAWAADGTPVGTVQRRSGLVENVVPSTGLPALLFMGDSQWRVRQDGLPVMTGQRTGLGARVRFNGLTKLVRNSDVLAGRGLLAAVPFTFRFRGRGVRGFEITRPAGQSRLVVTVQDPRIDRRLVLSCVLSINVIDRSHVAHRLR
jgi:hypothetical protein